MPEINSPFTMVVAIVALAMLASLIKTHIQSRANASQGDDMEGDLAALRTEVGELRDRVRVLERIATDKDRVLADEISRLS